MAEETQREEKGQEPEKKGPGKKLAAVYITLRLLVVAVMIAQIFNGDYFNVFLCFLWSLLLWRAGCTSTCRTHWRL